jgi:shikimate 5-dehydrogenase
MKSLAQSEKEGVSYAESVGAKSIKDLRAMSPAELSRQTVVTGGAWPIVDGYVIPDDQYKLYEAGRYNDVALLIGYNSDVVGFKESIEPLLKIHHKKALILGTGGASKAVYYALTKQLGLEAVFVSRYKRPNTVVYEDLDEEALREYEVVVNCSPVGMFPKIYDSPKIPYEVLNENNLLFDLVYNPDQTMFMQKGLMQGAVVKNGLEMLVLQALASWKYWNQ